MLKRFSRLVVKAIVMAVIAGIAIAAARTEALAQNAFDRGTPAESKSGLSGLSTYARDKIEKLNLANGNFAMHIPLVTVGGRGTSSYTIALSYNSKLWTGQHQTETITDPFGGVTIKEHYSVTYDDGVMRRPNQIALGSGWAILKAPSIKLVKVDIDPINNNPATYGYKYVMTKIWLVLPDGSEVEMRDTLTQGAPALTPVDGNGFHPPIDRDRGRVWRSTDGSAITYITDAANGVVNFQLDGYVFLPDGTRMRMRMPQSGTTARCTKIIDPNANILDINYNLPGTGDVTYKDQLGREVILRQVTGGATITIKGYSGQPDRVVAIDTAQIGATDASNNPIHLRSDFWSLQRPFLNGDYSIDFGPHTYNGNHTDLFYDLPNNIGSDSYLGITDVTSMLAVTKLNLLDGRSFKFRYNQFGELAEIVYPGGGASQIDYGFTSSQVCESTHLLSGMINRLAFERRVLTNGTTVDTVWKYFRESPSNPPVMVVEVRQGSGTGPLLMSERHFFMALDAEYRNCLPQGGSNGTANEKWENAKEYRVERKTGNGSQVLVEDHTWEQRAQVAWATDPNSGVNAYVQEHGQEQPPNDVRVRLEDIILENGKLKRVRYDYDGFNNVTSIKEYDFGQGVQGSLLRETTRSYLTSLNGYCYTNLNGIDSSCGSGMSTDPNAIIHRRRLLLNETVKDGAGNLEAYAEFEYDNYEDDTQDGNHKPLVANPGMIQYDGGWFPPTIFAVAHQPRGNVTKVSRLISGNIVGGTYSTSYMQYDEAGNVLKTKDPRGKLTTISYSDNFGNGTDPDTGSAGANGSTYALPTLITNAVGHQTKSQYDYTRGVVSGVKDANQVVIRSEYDNFDRPIRVTAAYDAAHIADQTITEMSYPTASANESRVSKQLDATRWLTSRTQFDGFGRVVLASQSEDGLHFSAFPSYTIHAKTIYDGLGRAWKVSNAYRSDTTTAKGWTRTNYDLVGRVTEVASFGGDENSPPPDSDNAGSDYSGSVITTYSSEQTTVRDQAGKQRRSTIDGLGRLKTVEELQEFPSTTVYSTTSYQYDARGNLTRVDQNNNGTSQVRRFAYDLMSRLILAANPEQNTDPQSPFDGQWTLSYEYDVASNLKAKIDTRRNTSNQFVRVDYSYDSLNRVQSRSYNDGTPAVSYTYDSATNGVGRLRSVDAAGVTIYNYTAYDALGRVTAYNQGTAGVYYTMENSYNKAGMVTRQKYPSGKEVMTEYDLAGRIAGVKNSAASGYYAGGAASDATNRMQYSAAGAVSTMKLGNGLCEHTNFNSRLQPTQIGLGTAQTNSTVVAIDYTYGASATTNNGNIASQFVTIGATTFKQSYTYDHVNRLMSAQEKVNNEGAARWVQSYGYDVVGNRTSLVNSGSEAGLLPTQTTPAVSGATNRVSASGYSYDSAGNMRSEPSTLGNGIAYDGENRQVSYAKVGGATTSYFYDGDGRRVKKQVGGVTTVLVYNVAGQMLAEYDSSTPQAALSLAKYMTTDHLGSTRVVTGHSQAVVTRYDYLPYGEEISAGVVGGLVSVGWGMSATLPGRSSPQKSEMMSRSWITFWHDITHQRRGGSQALTSSKAGRKK